MPVRKIKPSSFSYTGLIPSLKNQTSVQYESSLEADYIVLLEFTPYILKYLEQPVEISYLTDKGKTSRYTPDFLVHYHPDTEIGALFKPRLVEIKYREDLKKNWKQLKPKFQAAIRYASDQKYEFKILTEVEIRTPFLDNAKFLLSYKNLIPEWEHLERLKHTIRLLGHATVNQLLDHACQSDSLRAELIPVLWYMVSHQIILCDWHQPLTMLSELFFVEPEDYVPLKLKKI